MTGDGSDRLDVRPLLGIVLLCVLGFVVSERFAARGEHVRLRGSGPDES